MKEIVPGIYQLPLPSPGPESQLGPVNVYFVRDNNECLLIDSGWNTDEALASLQKQLAEINVTLDQIPQIIITHMHPDHIGLAGKLKELYHLETSIHHLDRELLEVSFINPNEFLEQVGQWMHADGLPLNAMAKIQPAMARLGELVYPVLPDIALNGGETFTVGSFIFHVLWTPGHSPGHISLYEPNHKLLIAGDHILADIAPHVGVHPLAGDNPLDDYIKSLNKLKRLEISLVLPGHKQPFSDIKRRIKEIIEYHEERSQEILTIIGTRPKTAYRIMAEINLPSHQNNVHWGKKTLVDGRTALMETLAYLESLRVAEKLERFNREGTIYYQAFGTPDETLFESGNSPG